MIETKIWFNYIFILSKMKCFFDNIILFIRVYSEVDVFRLKFSFFFKEVSFDDFVFIVLVKEITVLVIVVAYILSF